MKLNTNARFYDVRFTEPAVRVVGDREYPYEKNILAMVAAESVPKACEAVYSEHPLATIHQVNHRGGSCAILVQPELISFEQGESNG